MTEQPEIPLPHSAQLPLTGIGVDVHAFGPEGTPLWVAGLHWPGERGLTGHSDGDVVAHAAAAIGIKTFHAEVFPEEKRRLVMRYKALGKRTDSAGCALGSLAGELARWQGDGVLRRDRPLVSFLRSVVLSALLEEYT